MPVRQINISKGYFCALFCDCALKVSQPPFSPSLFFQAPSSGDRINPAPWHHHRRITPTCVRHTLTRTHARPCAHSCRAHKTSRGGANQPWTASCHAQLRLGGSDHLPVSNPHATFLAFPGEGRVCRTQLAHRQARARLPQRRCISPPLPSIVFVGKAGQGSRTQALVLWPPLSRNCGYAFFAGIRCLWVVQITYPQVRTFSHCKQSSRNRYPQVHTVETFTKWLSADSHNRNSRKTAIRQFSAGLHIRGEAAHAAAWQVRGSRVRTAYVVAAYETGRRQPCEPWEGPHAMAVLL